LCIAQCPLFTFGNHTTGYCQPCKLINNSMCVMNPYYGVMTIA
jgi:hypothetical protein